MEIKPEKYKLENVLNVLKSTRDKYLFNLISRKYIVHRDVVTVNFLQTTFYDFIFTLVNLQKKSQRKYVIFVLR